MVVRNCSSLALRKGREGRQEGEKRKKGKEAREERKEAVLVYSDNVKMDGLPKEHPPPKKRNPLNKKKNEQTLFLYNRSNLNSKQTTRNHFRFNGNQ